jgi:hypothetical protein
MQSLTGQLASLDEGASVLLVIIGLVYGLFGWRLIRWLVVVDALALAAICAAWAAKRGNALVADPRSGPPPSGLEISGQGECGHGRPGGIRVHAVIPDGH